MYNLSALFQREIYNWGTMLTAYTGGPGGSRMDWVEGVGPAQELCHALEPSRRCHVVTCEVLLYFRGNYFKGNAKNFRLYGSRAKEHLRGLYV